MELTPATLKLLSIFTIILGLFICFFGYRIFKLVLAITGFITGATFVAGVGFTLTEGNEIIIILIAGIAGGLIAAVLLLFLYSAGIFLLGAMFGIIVSSGILLLMNIDSNRILYILPAILGGILTLIFQKFMLVLTTSIFGAWITVISTVYLLSSDFNPLTPEFINNIGEIETYRIILSFIALSCIGFIVQYLIFPKNIKNIENPESEIRDES